MFYVRENNVSRALYNIVWDYQGSITHLVDDSDGTVARPRLYRPRAPGLVRAHQHERPAVRPVPGPLPQPRPPRPGPRLLTELQPLLLLPQ